jgi:hypothetical protein
MFAFASSSTPGSAVSRSRIHQHRHDAVPETASYHLTHGAVAGGAPLTGEGRQPRNRFGFVEGVPLLDVRKGDPDEALVGVKQRLG